MIYWFVVVDIQWIVGLVMCSDVLVCAMSEAVLPVKLTCTYSIVSTLTRTR